MTTKVTVQELYSDIIADLQPLREMGQNNQNGVA